MAQEPESVTLEENVKMLSSEGLAKLGKELEKRATPNATPNGE